MSRASGEIAVRALRTDDHAAVLALARELRRYFSPPDLREMATLLATNPTGEVTIDAAGQLAGFLLDVPADEPRVREIAWMGVAEQRQGRGIGTLLLEALLARLATGTTEALEVATVAASAGYAPYEATRAFYHRRGFVDLRVDPDYYWPGGDRLVLRRTICEGDERQGDRGK